MPQGLILYKKKEGRPRQRKDNKERKRKKNEEKKGYQTVIIFLFFCKFLPIFFKTE